jgi:hypothetical protein
MDRMQEKSMEKRMAKEDEEEQKQLEKGSYNERQTLLHAIERRGELTHLKIECACIKKAASTPQISPFKHLI